MREHWVWPKRSYRSSTAANVKTAICFQFFGFANEPALQLAEELVRLSPESLQHVFFTLGGSDAVDSTLKTIRYFFNVTGRLEKKHVIGLERGYHGVSSTGAGLTGLTGCHRFFDVPLPNQHHIPSHYRYRSSYGVTDAEIISGSVAALETKVADLGGSEKVAAFFLRAGAGVRGRHCAAGGLVSCHARCLRKARHPICG